MQFNGFAVLFAVLIADHASPLPLRRWWPYVLAVFVGVLGGIPAFGAIGVIAGPVVLSLVLALIEFAEESRPKIS